MKKVNVVITTVGIDWTKKCLPDLIENTDYEHNLHLVDDSSTGESQAYIDDFMLSCSVRSDKVRNIIATYNKDRRKVSGCWNIGINNALEEDADYIVILNNDIQFPPRDENGDCWLTKLVRWADEHPDHAWISPFWLWTGNDSGSIERFKEGSVQYMKDNKGVVEEGGLGCFFMMRSRAIKHLAAIEVDTENFPGKFDIVNYPTQWEEVDYILRLMRVGYKIAVIHDVALFHWGSAYIGKAEWKPTADKEYTDGLCNFKEKWCGKLNVPKQCGKINVWNGRPHYKVDGAWIPFI